jgi:hypothetical protein
MSANPTSSRRAPNLSSQDRSTAASSSDVRLFAGTIPAETRQDVGRAARGGQPDSLNSPLSHGRIVPHRPRAASLADLRQPCIGVTLLHI